MIQFFLDKFNNSLFIKTIENIAQRIQISRSVDLNLLTGYYFVKEEFKSNNIIAEAKAVAYNFTLAIFPAIIFLFTLLPYFEAIGLQRQELLDFLSQTMPNDLYLSLEETIIDLVDNKREELTLFGFLFSAFMSTNGMLALMEAFNRCYRTEEKRNIIKKYIIAFTLTILIIVVLILAMITIVFGGVIIDYAEQHFIIVEHLELARFLQYSAFLLVYFLVISFIYFIAPTVTHRWHFFTPGSVVATIISILVSTVFSYYINNFGTYNKVYGSIGTLIAFMIWVQWMSITLLIGFEVNAGIDRAKKVLKSSR